MINKRANPLESRSTTSLFSSHDQKHMRELLNQSASQLSHGRIGREYWQLKNPGVGPLPLPEVYSIIVSETLMQLMSKMAELLILVGGITAGSDAISRLVKRIRHVFMQRGRRPAPCLDAVLLNLVQSDCDGFTVIQLARSTRYSKSSVRRALGYLAMKGIVTRTGFRPVVFRMNRRYK